MCKSRPQGGLLAALRFYHQHNQGEPFERGNEIHALATDEDRVASSLDQDGIEALFQKVRATPPVVLGGTPAPDDELDWERLRRQRGWHEPVLQHAMHSAADPADYGPECAVRLPGGIEVRSPAGGGCSYVRVIDTRIDAGGSDVELAYWNSDEGGRRARGE